MDTAKQYKAKHAHRWILEDEDGTAKEFWSKTELLKWLSNYDNVAADIIRSGDTYIPGAAGLWRIINIY